VLSNIRAVFGFVLLKLHCSSKCNYKSKATTKFIINWQRALLREPCHNGQTFFSLFPKMKSSKAPPTSTRTNKSDVQSLIAAVE